MIVFLHRHNCLRMLKQVILLGTICFSLVSCTQPTPVVVTVLIPVEVTREATRQIIVTQEVTRLVPVTVTPRPTSTSTPIPTPTPLPTLTPTPTASPTPLPTPNDPSVFSRTIPPQARYLVLVFAASLLLLLFFWFSRFITLDSFKTLALKTIPNWLRNLYRYPMSLGFSFLLALLGLGTLALLHSPAITSLVWTFAWFLSADYYYEGFVVEGVPWHRRIRPYLLFGSLYLIAWSGFQVVAIRNHLAGTVAIYFVGIVFYTMANVKDETIKIRPVLKRRARDDMFLLILILVGFMTVEFAISRDKSATLAGSVIDELYQDIYSWGLGTAVGKILAAGRDIIYSVYSTLANAAVLEYYGYAAILVLRTMDVSRDKSQIAASGRIHNNVLWLFVGLLGVVTIAYGVSQMVIGLYVFSGSALILSLLLNGVVLYIGGFMLTQASTPIRYLLEKLKTDGERKPET